MLTRGCAHSHTDLSFVTRSLSTSRSRRQAQAQVQQARTPQNAFKVGYVPDELDLYSYPYQGENNRPLTSFLGITSSHNHSPGAAISSILQSMNNKQLLTLPTPRQPLMKRSYNPRGAPEVVLTPRQQIALENQKKKVKNWTEAVGSSIQGTWYDPERSVLQDTVSLMRACLESGVKGGYLPHLERARMIFERVRKDAFGEPDIIARQREKRNFSSLKHILTVDLYVDFLKAYLITALRTPALNTDKEDSAMDRFYSLLDVLLAESENIAPTAEVYYLALKAHLLFPPASNKHI